MRDIFIKFYNYFQKFKNNKLFDEIYVLLLSLIILLSWDWFFTLGTALVLIIAASVMLLLNNFKYLIPAGLLFIFSNRDGFKTDRFPIELFICFILLIASVVFYMYKNKNKINFNNNKSIIGLGLLAISCFIPIMWAPIPKDSPIYYLIYFSYFLYLIIYVLFAINLGSDGFNMFKTSLIYLAMLIAFEGMIEIYTLHVNYPNLVISSITYYSLGWGCCNEAGIMLLMAMPFIFLEYSNNEKRINFFITTIKLLIIGVGVIFTFSRGTYLFGLIELTILTLYTFFHAKNLKGYSFAVGILGIVMIISIQIMFSWPTFFKDMVVNGVFNNRLKDNNRFELWSGAVEIYTKDFVSLTFGSGVVSSFAMSTLRDGVSLSQIVYHSTFFEILITGGNLGLAFLIIHFIEKYYNITKFYNEKKLFIYVLISYIAVDIYGLIDNTYGMYYFMIPLVIMMSSIDTSLKVEKKNERRNKI